MTFLVLSLIIAQIAFLIILEIWNILSQIFLISQLQNRQIKNRPLLFGLTFLNLLGILIILNFNLSLLLIISVAFTFTIDILLLQNVKSMLNDWFNKIKNGKKAKSKNKKHLSLVNKLAKSYEKFDKNHNENADISKKTWDNEDGFKSHLANKDEINKLKNMSINNKTTIVTYYGILSKNSDDTYTIKVPDFNNKLITDKNKDSVIKDAKMALTIETKNYTKEFMPKVTSEENISKEKKNRTDEIVELPIEVLK